MYVISRNMKVAKDLTDTLIGEFSTPSAVNKAEGFIRREVLVNREAEYDVRGFRRGGDFRSRIRS